MNFKTIGSGFAAPWSKGGDDIEGRDHFVAETAKNVALISSE